MQTLFYGKHYKQFKKKSIYLFLLLLSQYSLFSSNPKKNRDQFLLPEIPLIIASEDQRINYLVSHYWDYFDFSNTEQVFNSKLCEDAFVNYISLFPRTTLDGVQKSISLMLNKALHGSNTVFYHFADLYKKYLYNPNSPFRQEDYYIVVLRSIIDNKRVAETYKTQSRLQLQEALKNRPGNPAADFKFTLPNGKQSRMSKISADYLILFFNNPDCHDCARVKEFLTNSSVIRRMTQSNKHPLLRILAVFPDEDVEMWKKVKYPSNMINSRSAELTSKQLYDLKAIPSLYLLDKNKSVILKDAPVEEIEKWLKTQGQTPR